MPPGIGAWAPSLRGRSATIASVVIGSSCNRGCALQSVTHDLGRVDDALACEITILSGLSVVAEAVGRVFEDLASDHRTVFACVGCDQAGRPGQSLADDIDTNFLVLVLKL